MTIAIASRNVLLNKFHMSTIVSVGMIHDPSMIRALSQMLFYNVYSLLRCSRVPRIESLHGIDDLQTLSGIYQLMIGYFDRCRSAEDKI